MLDDIVISRAIIETYNEDLIEYLDVDVAIAGGGPAGLTAARVAARQAQANEIAAYGFQQVRARRNERQGIVHMGATPLLHPVRLLQCRLARTRAMAETGAMLHARPASAMPDDSPEPTATATVASVIRSAGDQSPHGRKSSCVRWHQCVGILTRTQLTSRRRGSSKGAWDEKRT